MKTLLVLLVVLLVAGGLYTLVAGGVGGLVGAARSKDRSKGSTDDLTDTRRAPGDR